MRLSSLVLTLIAAAAIASPAAADQKPRHRKPSAPVTLTATAERSPDGWQVVVDAVPTRSVAAVELEVAGQRTRFGATAARTGRHLVVPIAVADGTGQDVVVAARVAGRSTAVIVRVGSPPAQAPKPNVTIRVVNGVTIAEVRQ